MGREEGEGGGRKQEEASPKEAGDGKTRSKESKRAGDIQARETNGESMKPFSSTHLIAPATVVNGGTWIFFTSFTYA